MIRDAAIAIPKPRLNYCVSPSLKLFNQSVQKFLSDHEQFDGVCTGALIYDNLHRILLIQRAASDSWPGRWEIPGGSCEDADDTILDGLVREVWEETGLIVKAIIRLVNDFGTQFLSRSGKRIIKFEFEIEVEHTGLVQLNKEEHEAFVWATEEECEAGRIKGHSNTSFEFTTSSQSESIMEAFRFRRLKQKEILSSS